MPRQIMFTIGYDEVNQGGEWYKVGRERARELYCVCHNLWKKGLAELQFYQGGTMFSLKEKDD